MSIAEVKGQNPEVKGLIVVDDWVDESVLGAWRFVTPADLLAAVRAGVESGTIEGKVEESVDCSHGHPGHSSMEVFDLDPGTYIVIGPVSDGGSET